MRIARYRQNITNIPVDFFADPDGIWSFDALVQAAGFEPTSPEICVGALSSPYLEHPEGAAVVAEMGGGEYIAIVECPSAEAPEMQQRSLRSVAA